MGVLVVSKNCHITPATIINDQFLLPRLRPWDRTRVYHRIISLEQIKDTDTRLVHSNVEPVWLLLLLPRSPILTSRRSPVYVIAKPHVLVVVYCYRR